MEFRLRGALALSSLLTLLIAGRSSATTVVPITDAELYQRADIVVHGTVVSSNVEEGSNGDPETVVRIRPIEVLKGGLAADLILRQPGGQLPDGRFFRLWGRPDYAPDAEVIVFALALPGGGYTTAEMFLGKLEVQIDEGGTRFATAPLHAGAPEGVVVRNDLRVRSQRTAKIAQLDSADAPRPLGRFLDYLRNGARGSEAFDQRPVGALRSLRRDEGANVIAPDWGPIGSLWRWNNGAYAGWTLDGTANITGGGSAEATRALATWTNEPYSTINHFVGGSNPIHLNAMTSSCGWSTCLTGGGVIGCGGPRGGGSHSWRGQNWGTITGGEVWLRCYATTNLFSSTITESVLLHELGHTLGLGHSDQDVHPQDTCRGDESTAIMRSSVQNRTSLGSDDSDAVRWLYGDGGKSCGSPTPTPTPTPTPPPTCIGAGIATQPTSRTINRGQSTTLSVVASGTTPISYQWYVGTSGSTGSPISGATSSSVTVSPSSTTSYWVRVSNACGAANSVTATVTVNVTRGRKKVADFNGDGVSEFVTFRTGAWLGYAGMRSQWTGPNSTNCIPAPGDFDGDGVTDYADWCGGAWHFFRPDGTYIKGIWTGGTAGDQPVPADFDGDGDDDPVIYSRGAWVFFDYATGARTRAVWTGPGGGTLGLPMDYDGDGTADFTVYGNGAWHFFNDDSTYNRGIWTGATPGDVPVPGDYDGDGDEDVVVFSSGAWVFYDFATRSWQRAIWTTTGQAAPLDYDGDGSVDMTVFRGDAWHSFNDNGSYRSGTWVGGLSSDRPVSRRQHPQP